MAKENDSNSKDIKMTRVEMIGMECVIEGYIRELSKEVTWMEWPNDLTKDIILRVIRINGNIGDGKRIYNLEDSYNDPKSVNNVIGDPIIDPGDEPIQHYVWDMTFTSMGAEPPHIGLIKHDCNGDKKEQEVKIEYGVSLLKKEGKIQFYGPDSESFKPCDIDYDGDGNIRFIYNVEKKKIGVEMANKEIIWCRGKVKLDNTAIYCVAIRMTRGTIFTWNKLNVYSKGYQYGKQVSAKRKGECVVV